MTAEVTDMGTSETANQVMAMISAASELTAVPADAPWRIRISRTDPPSIFEIELTNDELIEVTAGVADVISERLGFPPTIHKTQGY